MDNANNANAAATLEAASLRDAMDEARTLELDLEEQLRRAEQTVAEQAAGLGDLTTTEQDAVERIEALETQLEEVNTYLCVQLCFVDCVASA